jgi:hypothetical protein
MSVLSQTAKTAKKARNIPPLKRRAESNSQCSGVEGNVYTLDTVMIDLSCSVKV